MQTFIMRIHPVCPEPASKPSFTRQRAGPRTYVQFHSSRVQMRYGNDVDRVEVFSRSAGRSWVGGPCHQMRRIPWAPHALGSAAEYRSAISKRSRSGRAYRPSDGGPAWQSRRRVWLRVWAPS